MRALLGLVTLSLTLGGVAVGCGGTQTPVEETAALPPANPEAVRAFVSGNRALDRGNRRRARARFQKAVEIDPNLWEAHYNLGVLAREDGDLAGASSSFAAALAVNPTASEPLLAAAEVAYAQGDLEEASDRLEMLVRSEPDNLAARTALAVMFRERERWDDALAQAREVLVRDPAQVRALLEIGRVYRARESYDIARLVLEKALALAPEDDGRLRAEILNERGLLELDRGDTQAAFEAFNGAVEADAAFTPSRMNMGSVLLHAGDFAGAEAQYAAVLEADEDDLPARVALGISLRGQGKHRQARRAYEAVLEADDAHPDALLNLAVLQAEFLDQRPRALETFRRYLRAAPRRHPGRERAETYVQDLEAEAAPPTGGGGEGE